jgi:Pyruvate/2-oxoacid:ferredoxin oxidoreductase gamma subunit
MLGFLTVILSVEAIEDTVRGNVPKGTEELNLKAFRRLAELGMEERGVETA